MVRKQIEDWLTGFIIEHDICPFARRPWSRNLLKVVVVDSSEEEELTKVLLSELETLIRTPRKELETSIIVVPRQFESFDDFWSYCEWVQDLLQEGGVSGLLQVVGFHPHFRFAESEPDDSANFVNRSPYPLLHLLREESVTEAVAQYPDISAIPERNAVYLRRLSKATLERIVYGRHDH